VTAQSAPALSVIIVNYNGGEGLLECLQSLVDQRNVTLEVIVVDNCSTDGSVAPAQSRFRSAHYVMSEENDGYSGAGNRGAAIARAEFLLFLNMDIVLEPDCCSELLAALESGAGVAGPVLFVEASQRVEYGCQVDLLGFPVELLSPLPPLFVPGAALATPRRLFLRLGGFDVRYFIIHEDTEYCWRVLLSGAPVSVIDGARATHKGGKSAPGGYVRDGVAEISVSRVALRERNTIATMLSCAPGWWLALALPGLAVWNAGLMAASVVMRRPALAVALLQGLGWNAREFRATMRKRRSMPVAAGRSAAVAGRIHPGVYGLTKMRGARPRFVDRPS
jgi:Glycosyl transferase family 2